jgi:hypothetical protein
MATPFKVGQTVIAKIGGIPQEATGPVVQS